jgi:hypothetical protein
MRPTTWRTLEGSMRDRPRPATRDARPRQLPTVPSHAVPTGECQSDPPSLPRAVRCSSPRGDPPNRAGPLVVLLHVRASNEASEGIRTLDLLHGKQRVKCWFGVGIPADARVLGVSLVRDPPAITGKSRGFGHPMGTRAVADAGGHGAGFTVGHQNRRLRATWVLGRVRGERPPHCCSSDGRSADGCAGRSLGERCRGRG